MVEPMGPGPLRRAVGWVLVACLVLAPLAAVCGALGADLASDTDDDVEAGLRAGGKVECRTADGSLDALLPETQPLDLAWALSTHVEDLDLAPTAAPVIPPGPERGPPTLV